MCGLTCNLCKKSRNSVQAAVTPQYPLQYYYFGQKNKILKKGFYTIWLWQAANGINHVAFAFNRTKDNIGM